jgi:hypothetical protein
VLRRHAISSNSPLLKLKDKGFALLNSINATGIPSLIEVLLPPLHEYVTQPYYYTEDLNSGFPIAVASSVRLTTLNDKAWEVITEMSLGFYCSQPIRSLLASYKSNHEWTHYPLEIARIAHRDLLKLSEDADLGCFADLFVVLIAIFDDAKLNSYELLKENLDSLGHCDLHSSNLVVDGDRIVIIDFDNLSLAPAYSDSIFYAVAGLLSTDGLERSLSRIKKIVGRDVLSGSDVLHAISIALMLANWSTHQHRVRILHAIRRVCNIMKIQFSL